MGLSFFSGARHVDYVTLSMEDVRNEGEDDVIAIGHQDSLTGDERLPPTSKRSQGLEKLENGAVATVISNNFCLFDQCAAVVVLERMTAVRTEELVFFELRAHELTSAESADDLKELFAHVNREWECPRILPQSGASTMSIDE